MPVSVASANGRYVAGVVADGVDLSATSFVVRDLLTGRDRSITSNFDDESFDEGYEIEPLAVSDDGTVVRYASWIPCSGVCVATDAFFGSMTLAPVTDPTRGPAEDEVLRL